MRSHGKNDKMADVKFCVALLLQIKATTHQCFYISIMIVVRYRPTFKVFIYVL